MYSGPKFVKVPGNLSKLVGILRASPFVNHKGKDVSSDWLAVQWDDRSVLRHAQFHKGRMKCDDPEIDSAQTPKSFDGHLAPLERIRRTFINSIPNKSQLRSRWFKEFVERSCFILSKSLQKQGIDLQAIQIFKTTRSFFHFTLGIGNSFESVHKVD